MSAFESGPAAPLWPARRGPQLILLAGLGATVAYVGLLLPEWRQNPDLSHGYLAPVGFLLLLLESRKLGPLRWLAPHRAWGVLQTLLLAGGIILLAIAGLVAAAVGWSHALALFLGGTALVAFLISLWLTLADGRVRALPFNWIAGTAIILWLLVTPLPTGSYYRLTLFLQQWVTAGVMQALEIVGVPARQHGNVIELTHTTVGIAEACSGIRSLIACLYAGAFFAAWLVRRPARRAVLILAAPALAIGMNFVRSLTLTLLANRGVDIAGAWHDATGYAILALTALILIWLALRLETPPPADETATVAAGGPLPRGAAIRLATGGMMIAGLIAFFVGHSRPAPDATTAAPDLDRLLPAEAPGWQVRTADDFYQFTGILQTTHLLQRTYVRRGADGRLIDLTVYLAYWPPGQSVSRVAYHTPDACWPGAGWIAQEEVSKHGEAPVVAGEALSGAEYRLFRGEKEAAQNVWFWHVFDGRAIGYRNPYSLPALLQMAWRYGFGRQGSQYFVRISSTRPWAELEAEPLFRDITRNLRQIGL